MDEFKRANVIKATETDLNAKCCQLKDRKAVSKMVNRYARRKLKRSIKEGGKDD